MTLLSVDEARRRILATVRPRPAEPVPLLACFGRVLAEDVDAPIAVPPFDASAMDGWAVRAAEAPGPWRVVASVHAGTVGPPLQPGTAAPITTGAPLPEGADAVLILEDGEVAAGLLTARAPVAPGNWVRPRGADLPAGGRVLDAGTVLTPARVGLLASIGRTTARVAVPPRVAVLTTGDEVVRPGVPLPPGRVHDSNHVVLAGLVTAAGAVPVDAGHAPDDAAALCAALDAALEADVLLTTGGVSVGERDLVREALASRGVTLDFWKVRMKPGKPVAFGLARRDGREVPVFALPGNPVSCAVVFLELVRPWLRASLGDRRPWLPAIDAVAAEDLRSAPGRARFERVCLTREGSVVRAWSAGDGSSGVLSTLARADGLALIGPDEPGPAAGEPVRVHLLDPDGLVATAEVLGW